MVEAPPYKPCAPSFFILLWWSESAGTSFCGFPDLKKRRKCKKRLPGLPRAVFFVSAIPPLGRPAPRALATTKPNSERESGLQPLQGRHAPACRRTLATTKPNSEPDRGLQARLLPPSRTWNAKKVCKRARKAHPACRERLLPPSRTWNAKKVCKRASLRLFFRRRFL